MSRTEDNLRAAFAGESQARNKYTYYAKVARKEGYHYVAKIFDETADNEMRHAKDALSLFEQIGDTLANLRAAVAAEDHETKQMYPAFAKEAEAEGNREAAVLFKLIAKVEDHHRKRFENLLHMLEAGTLYKRDAPIKWKCSVCGYVHEGKEPPAKCPCCGHAREYFEPANMDV